MAVIQYIYLIQTREFVNSKEPIYKIGKSKQMNYTRFTQYPNGSIQLFRSTCNNCDILEQKIIKIFCSKYENQKEIGKEYFKGDVCLMINNLCHMISNEIINVPVKSFVKDIIFDIIENIIAIENHSITEEVITEDKIVKNIENEEDYLNIEVMYDGVVVEKGL